MRMCFHIAVVHRAISILVKQKGIPVLTNDQHLHEHFVMIRIIPLIMFFFFFIYIIKMYCFTHSLGH